MTQLGRSQLGLGWVSACLMQCGSLWVWHTAHHTNILNFQVALVAILLTNLVMHAPWCAEVQNQKADSTVSEICPFKSHFTAVPSLSPSGALFIPWVCSCYSCDWGRVCVGPRKRSTCENYHYLWMAIKYLNFYYPKERAVVVVVVMHSSLQGGLCSWIASSNPL